MSGALQARIDVGFDADFRLDVEFDVPPGTTVALLGPNGAGKSTVVAALAGLVPIDRGRVVLDGVVLVDTEQGLALPAEERQVGVVFQDYVLFPHLSVVENVAFGLVARGAGRAAARRSARNALPEFGLDGLGDRKPAELSGGEAQRVALARALVTQPALLLLDEPLAALDVTTRADLRHLLSDHLADFSGPRILITHDPTEAFLLADEIYVIENGAVTQHGSAEDIRLRPQTPYAADLAGANLLVGEASDGLVTVASHRLAIADTAASGRVLATVHPRAISLHRRQPEGSPRNTWRTAIRRVEHYGDRVRIQVGDPLRLTAEVTPRAVDALGLSVGDSVWVSIKATEISASPE
ncbi:MAG: ABC transporter ATP-binding protein [Acidimicrobiia bacterium]|nr:ABC transporter ATP-binding protein [Acidimicrobiia bacterium]